MHLHTTVEHPVPVIVELLYHTISPGLADRNEHELHTGRQAQPHHLTSGAWISTISEENQLVVELQDRRDAHSRPDVPQARNDMVGSARMNRFGCGAARGNIDPVQ